MTTLVWECEFNKDIKYLNGVDKNYYLDRMKHYNSIKKHGHVSIRESFFGGRTNNLKFKVDCKPGQKIYYLDVCSLYPYVLKSRKYPKGHPKVITEFENNDISGYFGFIKCKVLAPQSLYNPVLPLRLNAKSGKKLVFSLCKTCAENQSNEDCNHSIKDRAFYGTWTSMELQKAVEVGYQILKIYEVLHYEESIHDLFTGYINKFLKLKTEASGWPNNCVTQEERQQFVDEYSQRESKILN